MSAGTHVRCGFCPGATDTIVRASRGLCPSCVARLTHVRCPECDGVVMIDFDARTDAGSCTALFCTECEFCQEIER